MRTGLIAIAALFAAAAAQEAPIDLAAGGQRVVVFDRKVTTFYIADPRVLDAESGDSRHVTLIGKANGRTEILAVDAAGVTVLHRDVVVTPRKAARSGGDTGTVTLQRGFERVTYACHDTQCRIAQRGGGTSSAPTTAPTTMAMPQITLTPSGTVPVQMPVPVQTGPSQ